MMKGFFLGGAIMALLIACIAFSVCVHVRSEYKERITAKTGWLYIAISIVLSLIALLFF